jgi:hypothetical protein
MSTATLQAFEQDGVQYLTQFFALASNDLGTPEDDGTVPVWKHIASVGEYEGHPSGGFKFTHEAFDQIIENFEARATPLNVDYEHQTFNRSLKGAIDSAGWIVKLELRENGDELWALLNLLPEAAERVRAKKLRQCSPVIIPLATDRKTAEDIGFELRSLALTNDPFLDGLHPFQLTRVAAMTEDEQKKADAEAADKAKADEDEKAKKLAEGDGATDGGAAQSLIDRIASGAGADADSTLAILEENLDMLVKAVQDAVEKGGTPAENTAREMRQMSIHVGPTKAAKSDDRALEIAMNHKDSQIRKLTEELAVVSSKVDGFVKAREAAEAAALHAKVTELQKQGFVGKDEQAFNDALEMFRDKPAMAERIYSMQLPPVGLEGDKTDPVAKPENAPLLMSQLDDTQKATLLSLTAYGLSEKDALIRIAKQESN